MSLFFNMLSRLVITFLPRSKCLNFKAAITICSDFCAQETNVSHCFHISPSICHEVIGLDAMILVFWMLSFKLTFLWSCLTLIKRILRSASLSDIKVVSFTDLRLLIVLPVIFISVQASSSSAFYIMYSAYILYGRQWSRPFPRKRNAKRQNIRLTRPYKQLWKEEKWKSKEKRKDIPIWMQSSKE